VGDGESVCVCDGVSVDVGVCEAVPEPPCELVWEVVPACVSDCEAVRVRLGESVCEALCVCETDAAWLGVAVCEGL
jgi:hypothetical protein